MGYFKDQVCYYSTAMASNLFIKPQKGFSLDSNNNNSNNNNSNAS